MHETCRVVVKMDLRGTMTHRSGATASLRAASGGVRRSPCPKECPMSRWKLALIVVVLLVAGLVGWRIFHSGATPAGAGRRGAGGEADGPVPVTVVAAVTRDVPVYLTALGTVQALNTVTVNAQVGGQLEALHFAEGQEVKQGDLLAEIDPRTFQAALDQAAAKKKQDAAQLSASQSTLARYEELIKKNFVSAQDLENQRQTVRQQQAL